MRIGYPCQNLSIGCTSARTFRLASYSPQRLIATVEQNLACLAQILEWNAGHGILFFRITSDLVPFASHPVCRVSWQPRFAREFAAIGRFLRERNMRVSMHPDQFTLLNSPDRGVHARSVRELAYHAELLDLLGTNAEAKVQIHVGGAYGDKAGSLARFCRRWERLDAAILRRLAVENDDRLYTLADCLRLHAATGLPVILDVFHHELLNEGEPLAQALEAAARTWKKGDGVPIVDYSEQQPGARRGAHAEAIDLARFRHFLAESRPIDCDVMLEIKDKERSALRALRAVRGNRRMAGGDL
jgi:UV DNA damage endonuclease